MAQVKAWQALLSEEQKPNGCPKHNNGLSWRLPTTTRTDLRNERYHRFSFSQNDLISFLNRSQKAKTLLRYTGSWTEYDDFEVTWYKYKLKFFYQYWKIFQQLLIQFTSILGSLPLPEEFNWP